MTDSISLKSIAGKFSLEGDIVEIKPLGPGFINDTYIIKTEENSPDYILQRKNKNIFPDIPAMMDNILAVTEHIRRKVISAGGDPLRQVLTVVPTVDGLPYYVDRNGEYWAVCRFIEGAMTYERADTPQLAYKGGEGIGLFQSQLADFNEELAETIKGFHNIRYRFEQWDAALSRDASGRKESVEKEIAWIETRRKEMLDFWKKVENGEIPRRVTHNDTKISNILFDSDGNVLCVIDLDTVMSSTSLNDFGDAIRSYANTGDEDDPNLDNIGIDLEIFREYTRGYLDQRLDSLTSTEIEHLAFSAKYITYEQVLRFLMDYIDGDTYYKTSYADHNLVRTHAQQRLLESMESHYDTMCQIVDTLCKSRR